MMWKNPFGKPGQRAKRSRISEHIMFEAIMSHSFDSIYFKDKDSHFIYNNKHRAAKHGILDTDGMIGKTDFDYYYESNAKESLLAEQEILRTGRPVIGKVEKLVRLDGHTTWSSTSKYPLFNKNGDIIGTWGISRDITEYEMAKEALRVSESKHKAMIENIADVISINNSDGVITYISPNIERLFGWPPDELIGTSFDLLLGESDSCIISSGWLPKAGGDIAVMDCSCRHKSGGESMIHLTAVNLIGNPEINGVLINFHDITERKKNEQKILYLSRHDTLTGLYNRAFFDEEKKRLDSDRQLPVSIIMGDVNGLKLTNDAFGHSVGDRLLIEIANILTSCSRGDDTVCRIGGDEFCILMPRTDNSTAQAICERIYDACSRYSGDKPDGATVFPSISLGYATKIKADESIDGVQKDAEDFMYKRKMLEHNSAHSPITSLIKATMNETTREAGKNAERVIQLSRTLGKALGLSGQQLIDLDLLSALHDIGKLRIQESILSKPGKLTREEWDEIRKHPETGCRITQASSELTRVADCILCHHERWDGGGYPNGLTCEQIPLLSRIISVIDAYDAMTQDRPYRRAMTKEVAAAEIMLQAGRQFDPDIARIFVENVLEIPWRQPAEEHRP